MNLKRLMISMALAVGIGLSGAGARAEDAPSPEKFKEMQSQIELLTKLIQMMQQFQTLNRELQEIKSRLTRLEDLMAAGPSVRVTQKPPVTTGEIKLENRTAYMATIIVNSVSYRLSPGETRFLNDQPTGDFAYQVQVDGFGTIQPLRTRSLKAKETFGIIVYP